MSIPLYLGYWIKHEAFGGVAFAAIYSWAIISFVALPLLVVIEGALLVRSRLRDAGRVTGEQRAHAVGLVIGIGAMVVAFVVRYAT